MEEGEVPHGTVISVSCRPRGQGWLLITLSYSGGCAAFPWGLSHVATLTNTRDSVTEDERVWL